MTHVTCRLTAKNRDQLRNPSPMLGNQVRASFFRVQHIVTPTKGIVNGILYQQKY